MKVKEGSVLLIQSKKKIASNTSEVIFMLAQVNTSY